MPESFRIVFTWSSFASIALLVALAANAQPAGDARTKIRNIRDLARQGDEGVPLIAPYLRDADLEVRLESAKTLAEMGGPKVLEPLLIAAQDNDPEIQIRATDGLVNVYLPGFVKNGLSGTLRRVGTTIPWLRAHGGGPHRGDRAQHQEHAERDRFPRS